MVYEHDIPAGSRLYFGKSAYVKRTIERVAAETLYAMGYEEIVTPIFSYHQHEAFDDAKELVRLNDEENHEVSLRADSTADVIRIVTKRLGRSSEAKKWFYIQPVMTYPTRENYQVGAEEIGGDFVEAAKRAAQLLEKLALRPVMQLSNMRIPKLLHERYGVALDDLKAMHIEALCEMTEWMAALVAIDSVEDLKDLSVFPEDIAAELDMLRLAASEIAYAPIVVAPLFYAKMRYYDALVFRCIEGNDTLATGGAYRIGDTKAAGFALNVDACIARKMKEGQADE